MSPLARALLTELADDPEALRELAARLASFMPAPAALDDAGWLDAKRAAEYAGCSVHSLHQAMAARRVHFEQETPGGKAYFRHADISTWRRGGAPSSLRKRD